MSIEGKGEFTAPYMIAKVNNKSAYIVFDSGSKWISIFNHSVEQSKLSQKIALTIQQIWQVKN